MECARTGEQVGRRMRRWYNDFIPGKTSVSEFDRFGRSTMFLVNDTRHGMNNLVFTGDNPGVIVHAPMAAGIGGGSNEGIFPLLNAA